MRFCRPPLEADGWHFEAILTWRTIGLGIVLTWDHSYVLWLGPLTLMLWRFQREPEPTRYEITVTP